MTRAPVATRSYAPFNESQEAQMAHLNPNNEPVAALSRDEAAERAAKWEPFVLLRTVVAQSSSSLVTEAMLTLDRLESDVARLREAEALGDA